MKQIDTNHAGAIVAITVIILVIILATLIS